MTIILKASSGREIAVNMALGGWEAIPIENDMSKVEIKFAENAFADPIAVAVEDYTRIKQVLAETQGVMDLTS